MTDESQSTKPRQHDPDIPKIRADELFNGHREVSISFKGGQYRLRITRNDKLILTK